MQPLLEQTIAACAQDDWDKANELASQYASIQFDNQLLVAEAGALKEAYSRHELSLFLRCRSNFVEAEGDGF